MSGSEHGNSQCCVTTREGGARLYSQWQGIATVMSMLSWTSRPILSEDARETTG